MSSSMYVEQNYEMDPKFEVILESGQMLQNGMVVLFENPNLREDLAEARQDSWSRRRANEANRWCTVSRLRFYTTDFGRVGTLHPTTMVEFVGVYGDGSRKTRSIVITQPWIVKIDSIPKPDDTSMDIVDRLCQAYGVEPTLENLRRILSSQDGRDVLNGL